MHDYLSNQVVVEKWARAMFKGERYNIITTNIIEALNLTLKKAREYLYRFDLVVEKMVEWFNEKWEKGSEFDISTYTKVQEMSISCLDGSRDVGTYKD